MIWIILATLVTLWFILLCTKWYRIAKYKKSIKYKIYLSNQLDTLRIVNEYKEIVKDIYELLNDRYGKDSFRDIVNR